VSDQDFFFEEDEQPKETVTTGTPGKSGAARPATSAAAPSTVQTVTMSVAALIGVIALLAGVIIGLVIPTGPGATAPGTVTTPGATQGSGTAPQLSPEQLEGGELPPNHPPVGGGGTSGQGSTETTAK